MALTEKEGLKAGSLLGIKRHLMWLYRREHLNEDELEKIEEPINKILEEMGVREVSEEF